MCNSANGADCCVDDFEKAACNSDERGVFFVHKPDLFHGCYGDLGKTFKCCNYPPEPISYELRPWMVFLGFMSAFCWCFHCWTAIKLKEWGIMKDPCCCGVDTGHEAVDAHPWLRGYGCLVFVILMITPIMWRVLLVVVPGSSWTGLCGDVSGMIASFIFTAWAAKHCFPCQRRQRRQRRVAHLPAGHQEIARVEVSAELTAVAPEPPMPPVAPIATAMVVGTSIGTSGGVKSGGANGTLSEMVEVFKREMGLSGTVADVVHNACKQLGLTHEGKPLLQAANEAWIVLHGAPPQGCPDV